MRIHTGVVGVAISAVLVGAGAFLWTAGHGPAGGPMSCATFAVSKGETLLIGHNLDDAQNETPGLVVVNKRGVA